MAFEKNTSRKITFDMQDTAGVYQTAKTVTVTISKDGGAFAAAAGTVAEVGNGAYVFTGTAADFNCDAFALRFTATGCRDTFVYGNTEADYTGTRAAYIDRVNTALPNVAAGANGGLPLGDASARVLLQPAQPGVTIPTVTTLTGHTPQTGDNFARIGAAGAGLTSVGVASLAANSITAAAIATDAIDADALAASGVAEIQSGLSTYAGGDTAGTTSLLGRLTSTRAGYLDGLSAGIPTPVQNSDAVWSATTRSLTTFGTLVADTAAAVWGAATRTLTAFGFTVNTNPNATETAIKTVTDELDPLIVTGAFTTAALANSPAGGGGSGAVTLDLTQTVDGVAIGTLLTELLAMSSGDVVPVDNGNGTHTLAFKKRDGTTNAFSIIYNPTTGARS